MEYPTYSLDRTEWIDYSIKLSNALCSFIHPSCVGVPGYVCMLIFKTCVGLLQSSRDSLILINSIT
jgi:hypothetical protein